MYLKSSSFWVCWPSSWPNSTWLDLWQTLGMDSWRRCYLLSLTCQPWSLAGRTWHDHNVIVLQPLILKYTSSPPIFIVQCLLCSQWFIIAPQFGWQQGVETVIGNSFPAGTSAFACSEGPCTKKDQAFGSAGGLFVVLRCHVSWLLLLWN